MSKRLWLIYFILAGIYLVFSWRTPFSGDNTVSNLSPFLDTFHYSNPAWNWVNGKGFNMVAFGQVQQQVVPPLYGITMIPFFAIFNDVRSYFYTNIIINLISIWLFVVLVSRIFKDSKIKDLLVLLLGFLLVTNFYFYYLPSLLMTENLTILLIMLSANLLLSEISLINVLGVLIVCGALALTKLSNFPVIAWLLFWTGVRLVRGVKVKKLAWIKIFIIFSFVVGLVVVKMVIPNWNRVFVGDIWFNIGYVKANLEVYLPQFLGINGHYLWFKNPQVESVVGIGALLGLIVGLFSSKYRQRSLIILSLVVAVVGFFSMAFYPEGRYISVVVPLYIVALGIVFELISQKNKLFALTLIFVFGLSYLGTKATVNGFHERKYTSLKREMLNRKLGAMEKPNNYVFMTNMNSYFENLSGENYLGTYVTSFYFYYFGNQKYELLAISEKQELGDGIKHQWFTNGTLLDYYEQLLNSGNNVYITDYFISGIKDGEESWNKIEDSFNLKLVKEFEDSSTLYRVELKK